MATWALRDKIRTHALRLVGLAVLMFGFGYALVPLYDLLCDVTGLNGKVSLDPAAPRPDQQVVDLDRTVKMRFVTVKNDSMPWDLVANQRSLIIHPGKVYQVDYTITNNTNMDMAAQAVPSIAPSNGASALKKIQCFCFDNIKLKANESMQSSVLFYVENDLAPEVHSLTLSYTLFDVTPEV